MCELNGVHFTNEGFFCILGGILKVFSKILESNGITATVRRTLGSDIDASCGQLKRRLTEEKI